MEAARGDWLRAARLLGAAEALGFARALDYQGDEYTHVVGALRAALDPEVFRSAWDDGRATPLDDAVAYALLGAGSSSR